MRMKMFFNQLIIKIIPYLPFFIIRLVAGRYVAGETIEDALKVVKTLNDKGFSATIDILGEHTRDINTSKEITNSYKILLKNIFSSNLDCNLSIKPSHIGMDINNECIDSNLSKLIETARRCNNFIRIDMEDSKLTDATILLYKRFKEQYSQIGIVLQACLHRSENDFLSLQELPDFNFRLCKGIYRESPKISFHKKQTINNNFLKLLRFAFENKIYIGIATHDLSLIKESYNLINKMNIPNDYFEFQVLYGVPMSGWLAKLREDNYKVRVYVPFGHDWYDYSVRRLKENPNIAGYVLSNLFRK